jgi:hypothetical protein
MKRGMLVRVSVDGSIENANILLTGASRIRGAEDGFS